MPQNVASDQGLHCLLHIQQLSDTAGIIKVLTALVGPLSLSVGWENGPERGIKTFIQPLTSCNLGSADLDQMPHSVASDLGMHCLPRSQSRFYR